MTDGTERELALVIDALPPGTVELAEAWWRLLDGPASGDHDDPDQPGRPVAPADPPSARIRPAGIAPAPIQPAGADELRRIVLDELTLPLRVEPSWPPPAAPIRAGDGWIHDETVDADLDRHGDSAVLADLIAAKAGESAEAIAAAAQEMRLPVTPYRPRSRVVPVPSLPSPVDRSADEPIDATGRRVVDLTTHWAGPLATRLLAERGAEVVKVDPTCRPDGFRARPALYAALNAAKEVIDLDLRRDTDRATFEALLADADLVVESFSRRVLANFGYDPARLAALGVHASTLAIRAFPVGRPEWNWLAYGPGAHAASGLALPHDRPDGPPLAAPIAYPDVLAGMAAAAHGLRLLGRAGRYREITLAGAIAPLVERAADEAQQREVGR